MLNKLLLTKVCDYNTSRLCRWLLANNWKMTAHQLSYKWCVKCPDMLSWFVVCHISVMCM